MAAPASGSWSNSSGCWPGDAGHRRALLAYRAPPAARAGRRAAVVPAGAPITGPARGAAAPGGRDTLGRLRARSPHDRRIALPLPWRGARDRGALRLEPPGLAAAVAVQRALLRRPRLRRCPGAGGLARRAGGALAAGQSPRPRYRLGAVSAVAAPGELVQMDAGR